MKIKRIGVFCITLLITLFLFVAFVEVAPAAKGVITARMGMIAPEAHPVAVASARFAKLVGQRTRGRIKVLTFPGGTLGGETELIDLVQSGVLEMANIGISGAYGPRFEAPVCLFYLFPNENAMWQYYGSLPYKEELLRVQKERNTIMLSMNWWQGWRHVIANKPIRTVEDFKGLKLRYPVVDDVKAKFYAALGAKGEPIEFPEVYEALQRGIVDGFECPLYWIYGIKAHEVVKHLALTSHITYLNSPIVNRSFWEKKLTPAEREVMLTTAWECGVHQNELQRQKRGEILEKMKATGVQVYELSDEDVKKLVSLCERVQLEWAEEKGVEDWFTRIKEIIQAVE
jgi:TRAP-type C4-dicarboxylate transport system substrate-binding protein